MEGVENYKLTDLFNELDSLLNASVVGERVEIIITPSNDNRERTVTVGLQNGFSRNRSSFTITDGSLFDEKVLPLLMEYYQKFDGFKPNIRVSAASIPMQTNKAILETNSGNLLYLETYNKDLIDRLPLVNTKKEKSSSLLQQDLEWQAILEYSRARRVTNDYLRPTLTDSEREQLETFVKAFSSNRELVAGYSKVSRDKVVKKLSMLFNSSGYNDDLKKEGITSKTYDEIMANIDESLRKKINNTVAVENLAILMQAENKLNNFIRKNKERLTTSIEEFHQKVNFAISELAKTRYYEKRNASYSEFSEENVGKNYGDNCAGKIIELKKMYEEGAYPTISSEQNEKYLKYCDEILEYLKAKSKESHDRKSIRQDIGLEDIQVEIKKTENTEFEYEENLRNLFEKIDLCKSARVNDEKFEIIITADANDKNKRLVRISLTNGMSRTDSFQFEFTDGYKFDEDGLFKIMEKVTKEDKIIDIDDRSESFNRTLFITENGNELLIDDEILSKLRHLGKNDEIADTIVEGAEEAENLSDEDTENVLEAQITNSTSEDIKTPSFEELKKLTEEYEFKDEGNNLIIVKKGTNEEYHPSSVKEKDEIVFALYWSRIADLKITNKEESESFSFSGEASRLFNILDTRFKQSIKDGTVVDFDSIKEDFSDTNIVGAEQIYNRLFKSEKHKKFLVNYYLSQLDMLGLNLDNFLQQEHNDELKEQESPKTVDYNPIKQIDEAYEIAAGYSNEERKASLKVHFPKEDERKVEVIVSYGNASDEDVIFQSAFEKEGFISQIMPQICDIYAKNSGISTTNIYNTPNTDKALLIATGDNDNMLQVTNAKSDDIRMIDNRLKDLNVMLSHSRGKSR